MKSKICFVTGSSSGLGRALVHELLNQGHIVIGISKSLIPPKQTKQIPNSALFYQYKMNFAQNCEDKITQVFKNHKRHIQKADQVCLIHNAAVIQPINQIENLKEKDIELHIKINLVSSFVVSSCFLMAIKNLKKQKLIVHITSGAANKPVDGWGLYCSTKAGLDRLISVIALQKKADLTFKVVGFSPGVMDTNMQKLIRAAPVKAFPDVKDFIKYKNENVLKSTEYVAKDLLDQIQNFSSLGSGSILRIR